MRGALISAGVFFIADSTVHASFVPFIDSDVTFEIVAPGAPDGGCDAD